VSISHQWLLAIIFYDPETGLWTWKKTRGQRVQEGCPAGSVSLKTGYRCIKISGKKFRSSRLAWFYMTGGWPARDVDHRDLIKSNDRWSNLRLATEGENRANTRAGRNNTSGFKGVSRRGQAFAAQIRVDGHLRHLGYFKTGEAASAAYLNAAKLAFGEFARTA
jgi:hypothetical protein